MSKLKDIQGNWEYERAIKPEDVDWLIQQAERVRDLEDDIGTLTLELDTFDVRMVSGLQKRVDELEEELKSLYKHAKELSEENIPMSSIAVKKSIEKILAGDNS